MKVERGGTVKAVCMCNGEEAFLLCLSSWAVCLLCGNDYAFACLGNPIIQLSKKQSNPNQNIIKSF